MADAASRRHYDHWKYSLDTPSIQALLCERERLGNGRAIHHSVHGHSAFMRRLAVDATLVGHAGCVNHLRWNRTGSLLASGSDDTKLIVWDYSSKKRREVIDTGHRLNIFAVCFVPHTHDHILATGAMDKEVRIHYAPFRRDATKRFRFHTGRVKDIASSQAVPKVFWSVAEDGLVYQFDVRALPRSDGSQDGNDEASGVLIRLGKARNGSTLRGMAMATHPLDETKVAVACGDFYSRMYDRRMLRTQPYTTRRHSSNGTEGGATAVEALTSENGTIPVEIFAPPHLHLDSACAPTTRRHHDEAHGTSIQFSSDGSEILANYHNDHIYLFRSHYKEPRKGTGDVVTPTTVFDKSALPNGKLSAEPESPPWMEGIWMDHSVVPSRTAVTRNDLQVLYSRGLVFLLSKNHIDALYLFSEICSARKQLSKMSESFRKDVYHGMAKAYLGRGWRGDDYVAAQYAKLAETLDPRDREVQLTLIRALKASRRNEHLIHRGQLYQFNFPMHSEDVESMLADARSRQAMQNDRRMRVFRRRANDTSDDSSSDDASSQPDSESHGGMDDGEGDEEELEREDGEEELSEEELDDDDVDDIDASSSSEDTDGELHIEEVHAQPDSEDAADDETDGITADDDAKFWKSSRRHGLRVNCDVARRFIGYCNLQTDIKEASFFGPNDECIVAGSDDGKAYIWHKNTGKLLNAIDADADIVNCVQPHPVDTCLATSGIENVIRLWTPTSDGTNAPSDEELEAFVENNQASMADSANYYMGGANPNIIRLIFQSAEQEGVQECATS